MYRSMLLSETIYCPVINKFIITLSHESLVVWKQIESNKFGDNLIILSTGNLASAATRQQNRSRRLEFICVPKIGVCPAEFYIYLFRHSTRLYDQNTINMRRVAIRTCFICFLVSHILFYRYSGDVAQIQ